MRVKHLFSSSLQLAGKEKLCCKLQDKILTVLYFSQCCDTTCMRVTCYLNLSLVSFVLQVATKQFPRVTTSLINPIDTE